MDDEATRCGMKTYGNWTYFSVEEEQELARTTLLMMMQIPDACRILGTLPNYSTLAARQRLRKIYERKGIGRDIDDDTFRWFIEISKKWNAYQRDRAYRFGIGGRMRKTVRLHVFRPDSKLIRQSTHGHFSRHPDTVEQIEHQIRRIWREEYKRHIWTGDGREILGSFPGDNWERAKQPPSYRIERAEALLSERAAVLRGLANARKNAKPEASAEEIAEEAYWDGESQAADEQLAKEVIHRETGVWID